MTVVGEVDDVKLGSPDAETMPQEQLRCSSREQLPGVRERRGLRRPTGREWR